MTDTPKRDWAEESAQKFFDDNCDSSDANGSYFLELFDGSKIAPLLRKIAADKEAEFIQRERKARANGVREACDWIWNNKDQCGWSTWISLGLNKLAKDIEDGQP